MEGSRLLTRLVEALSESEYLGGQSLLVDKTYFVNDSLRALAAKGKVKEAPILFRTNVELQEEETTEALAWMTALIPLGLLEFGEGGEATFLYGQLEDDFPNLRLTNDWFLKKARNECCYMKEFIWAVLLLVDPVRYKEVRESNTLTETRRILSAEWIIPVRLLRLWEKCQHFRPSSLERLVGNPRQWAEEVIAKK